MNPMVHDTIAIAIGAICGAITRYQTGKVVTEYITQNVHPNDLTKQSYYLGWHTAFINITGSFLLGAIFATPSISAGLSTAPASNTVLSQLPLSSSSSSSINNKNSNNKSTEIPRLQRLVTTSANAAAATATAVPSSSSPSPSSTGKFGLTPRLKLLLGVGFCGSYTTFSTYSVDIVSWIIQGQTHKALSYFAINNIGGIAAAAVGMTFMKKLLGATSTGR